MPMNEEVRKAVAEVDAWLSGEDTYADWMTIHAELTRLYAIADSVDPLVVRLGEVTGKLEAANALLEIIRTGRDGKKYDYVEARDGHMVLVAEHLQGAGDEAV